MGFQLSDRLCDSDLLVFFDIEGTQFTHRMIALGMVCYPKKKGEILFDVQHSFSYHTYVKTDDLIGPVVEKMTGITQSLLLEEGKNIHDVVLEISRLLRPYHAKFLSYGISDVLMLRKTLDSQNVTEENFFRYISKNYFDFHHYVSKRICDIHGQSLSVSKLIDLYQLQRQGNDHDPLCDAKNLALIYDAYVRREDDDIRFFYENLIHNREAGSVFKEVTQLLMENKCVKEEELMVLLRNHL